MKRWLLMLGVVLLLVLVIGGIKGYGIYTMVQGFKAAGVPKQTVSTIKVSSQDWLPQLSAVGGLHAVRGADLSSEVAGVIEAIEFQSGEPAKAGELLVQLRAQDEIAHLNSLKASAELAETVFKRDRAQLEAQAIAQATIDSDSANLKSARAQVDEQAALVEKKSIRAPFAGELGIRAVDLGQYIAAGTKIVTLQQLDPIYLDFSLPQQALAQIAVGQVVTAKSDSYPSLSFAGEVSAIDPQIDSETRNVLVRATLKNADHKLLPGMFATVSISSGAAEHHLTLPNNAITFNPYGETVFVITTAAKLKAQQDAKAANDSEGGAKQAQKPEAAGGAPEPSGDQLVVKQVFVTVGPTRGDQIAILSGIQEGDEVVTSGTLKLKAGTAVEINNSVQPKNDANPKPTED